MDDESKGGITQKRHQTFRLGDTVRIMSGPFTAFAGKIEGINQAKTLLKVRVIVFGRTKPIKLSFKDVEVVSFS
jgi:transcription termination/antitermination protein NusG